jgi:maleate isomerase
MIQQTCINGAQAVSTYCTNLHAAQLAEGVEQSTGVPLLDTVSTTVWGALTKLKLNPAQIKGWGQLYQW